MGLRDSVLCCLVLVIPALVAGEAVFVCPPPRPGANDTSMAPCGGGRRAGGTLTVVEPGPLSIKWTDTARLNGSSYRVTLRSWDSDTVFCVLVDRVPSSSCVNVPKPKTYTDNSTANSSAISGYGFDNSTIEDVDTANSTSNGTGISNMGNSTTTVTSKDNSSSVNVTEEESCATEFFLTVDIPSVTCDNCYLQITTIDTQGSDCLVNLDSVQSECPLYYSCTNIRITGSLDQETQTLGQCGSQFLKHKDDWPYKPDNMTRKFALDFQEHLDVFKFAFGTFHYIPIRRNFGRLTYDVQLWVNITVALNDVTVVWPGRGKKWITFRTMKVTDTHGTYSGTMRIVSQAYMQLMNDKWHIRIDHRKNVTAEAEMIYIPLVRSAEVYSDISGNYTQKGWLSGPPFDGETAPLSSMVTPAGDCPPKPPTTTTQSTTTDDLQTKAIPKDPEEKDRLARRMEKTRSFFTKSASGRMAPSLCILTILILSSAV